MSFESDINRFSIKLKKGSPKAVRKIVFLAYSMITEGTPVDTGRAKGNWFVQAGSPSNETTESTTVDIMAQVGKVDGTERDIYISNNLKYIVALEHGSSLKKPLGMVRISLLKLERFIASGKIQLED